MTTLLLDAGHRLLTAPLSAVAAEVLDLLAAEPSVSGAELVMDGRAVARSGKPGEAGVLPLPLAGAGELRIAYDAPLSMEQHRSFLVLADLMALAARTEIALADERRALADDLHDGVVQTLIAARLMPGRDLLGDALVEVRELMRSLRERPPAVTLATRLARVSGGTLTTDSGDHVVTIEGSMPARWAEQVRSMGGDVRAEDGRYVVRIPGAAA